MSLRVIKSDDAVSGSLAFIILIGILLTSISIIFVIGYPVYTNYVDQSHMQNMIEAFDLVSENANNVALLSTPYQQSEIKLYSGSIAIRSAGTMLIECYNEDGAVIGEDVVNLNILEYSKGDNNLAYVLGGVFTDDLFSYPVIKEPPAYSYDTDGTPVLFIPLISLSTNDYWLAGNTLARISFGTYYYSKKTQDVLYPEAHTYENVKRIKITLHTDTDSANYNEGIYTYFKDEFDFDKIDAESDDYKLVMNKDCVSLSTVNTVQGIVIGTINEG